jgi:hypothetical protein
MYSESEKLLNLDISLPEYRKILLSVHICEAVLEHDIRGLGSFWPWWKARYGNPP